MAAKAPVNPDRLRRVTKIFLKHVQYEMGNNRPNVLILPDPNPPKSCASGLRVIALVVGLGDPWRFGEWFFTVDIPVNDDEAKCYPNVPPDNFKIHTIHSLYQEGGKMCVSIGEYHKKNWHAGIKFGFIYNACVSAMIGHEDMDKSGGIRLKKSTLEEKRQSAVDSRADNAKKNPEWVAMFEDYMNDNPQLTAVHQARLVRLGVAPEAAATAAERIAKAAGDEIAANAGPGPAGRAAGVAAAAAVVEKMYAEAAQ